MLHLKNSLFIVNLSVVGTNINLIFYFKLQILCDFGLIITRKERALSTYVTISATKQYILRKKNKSIKCDDTLKCTIVRKVSQKAVFIATWDKRHSQRSPDESQSHLITLITFCLYSILVRQEFAFLAFTFVNFIWVISFNTSKVAGHHTRVPTSLVAFFYYIQVLVKPLSLLMTHSP